MGKVGAGVALESHLRIRRGCQGANEQLGTNQMQQRDDDALHCVCRAQERPDPLNSEVSGNLRICLQDQI